MRKIVLFLVLLLVFTSCKVSQEVISTITVKNTLNIDRNFETIEIDISGVASDKVSDLVVLDTDNEIVTSQIVDADLDGKNDVILFQPTLKANQSKKYSIAVSKINKQIDTAYCYSRFVPERTDLIFSAGKCLDILVSVSLKPSPVMLLLKGHNSLANL